MSNFERSDDPIWINEFSILFKTDKLNDFFPSKEQTQEERINSLVRLSFYVAIILCIYFSNYKFLSIFVFFLFFTFIIYNNHPSLNSNHPEYIHVKQPLTLNNFTPNLSKSQSQVVEGLNNTEGTCTKPTLNNPFMNFTMNDYLNISDGYIVNKNMACDPNDPEIKKQIDNSFNNNLFHDVSDVWGKMNSQRQFYTNPSTQIVNDRESFQNWLSMSPETCKENQEACSKNIYEDLRNNSFTLLEHVNRK